MSSDHASVRLTAMRSPHRRCPSTATSKAAGKNSCEPRCSSGVVASGSQSVQLSGSASGRNAIVISEAPIASHPSPRRRSTGRAVPPPARHVARGDQSEHDDRCHEGPVDVGDPLEPRLVLDRQRHDRVAVGPRERIGPAEDHHRHRDERAEHRRTPDRSGPADRRGRATARSGSAPACPGSTPSSASTARTRARERTGRSNVSSVHCAPKAANAPPTRARHDQAGDRMSHPRQQQVADDAVHEGVGEVDDEVPLPDVPLRPVDDHQHQRRGGNGRG